LKLRRALRRAACRLWGTGGAHLRLVRRRLAAGVAGKRISAVLEQELNHFKLAEARGNVERGGACGRRSCKVSG